MLPRLFLTILPVCSPSLSDEQWGKNKKKKKDYWLMVDIVKLSFAGRQLALDNTNEISKIVDEIHDQSTIEILDFSGNTFSVLAGERVADELKNRSELRECYFADMFTGRLKDEIPKVLDSFAGAFTASGCRLTTLDLSDNAFGAGLSDCLSRLLTSPALYSLQNLILNNNGLGLAGVTVGDSLCRLYAAAKQAKEPLNLKKFVCGRNRLEVTSTIALTNAFIMMQTLEEIYLPQNGIRDEAVIALIQAFAQNKNLRVIDLNDNVINDEATLEFADILNELPKLEVLDLGSCLLEDDGVMAICCGLDPNQKSLKKIVLSANGVTRNSIDELGELFSREEFRHVHVDLSESALGSYFNTAVRKYKRRTNIEFGNREDDEGGDEDDTESEESEELEDSEEDRPDDASMEEDPNTSRDTVITRENMTEEMISKMLCTGVGCMNIAEEDENKREGIVSFRDKSLKLDTAESAHEVVRTIRSYPVMKTFELRGNTLGKEAGKVIAAAMERHPELERCLWSDMFTGRLKNEIPPILEALGRAMINVGCKIRELDLSDNAFGPIGAEALKEFLESPSAYSLETLRLNNNGLGAGGRQIAKSLSVCLKKSVNFHREVRFRLKNFIAGRNRLENPGAIALARTFKNMRTIEHVDVRQNGIQPPGLKALVAGLAHNLNLRFLWFEDNTMLPKGARHMSKHLARWPKLEVLNLSDCLLGDAGCNYIVENLNPAVHRQLKHVYLCGNEMTAQCALLLIDKWAKFKSFNPRPILHIHTNNFGEYFSEVEQSAAEMENVSVGDEDDDLGSLEGDLSIYNSREPSSDDADLESAADSDDNGEKNVNMAQLNSDDDVQEVPHGQPADVILKDSIDRIDQLDIDFESRFQEDTAKVILQISRPLQNCNMDPIAFKRAVEVAENIVTRVAAVKRNPIPTTTQLINNIVAQCAGSGVKLQPEVDWGYNASPKVIGQLLHALVARGHFKNELDLIRRFFPF